MVGQWAVSRSSGQALEPPARVAPHAFYNGGGAEKLGDAPASHGLALWKRAMTTFKEQRDVMTTEAAGSAHAVVDGTPKTGLAMWKRAWTSFKELQQHQQHAGPLPRESARGCP